MQKVFKCGVSSHSTYIFMNNPKTLRRRGMLHYLLALAMSMAVYSMPAQTLDNGSSRADKADFQASTTADSSAILPTSDSVKAVADTTAVAPQPRGLVARLLRYFAESDKPKPNKKIDFGIIGGPHYASDTGFGVGLVASALYSTDRSDSTLEKSNASLYSDVTSKAFLMIGLRGNNIFPRKRYRLDYRLYVYTFPSYLWGFSYPQSDNDDNKSKYSRTKACPRAASRS